MKTQEKENILQRSITRRRRKSMEHTHLLNSGGGGVGSQIREKYIQGGAGSNTPNNNANSANSGSGANSQGNNNAIAGSTVANSGKRRGSINVMHSVNSMSSYQNNNNQQIIPGQQQIPSNLLPVITEESGSVTNKQVITTSELLKKRAYPSAAENNSINENEKN